MPTTNPYQPEKEPNQIEDIFSHEGGVEVPVRRESAERPIEKAKESIPESRPEQRREMPTESETSRRAPIPPQPAAPSQVTPAAKSPELVQIETILSEHLDELYLQMTPEQQIVFQQKGEEAANKIEQLMSDVKLKVKEILGVIRDWLSFIPGINKFFLEQEAKIKTDRLLSLHEQKHKK